MPRALSFDLRVRVLTAVARGLSHRQAGERFGVSAASVSRWRALERERGEARARSQGGDRRSGRFEAHKDTCLVSSFDGAFLSRDLKDALWAKFLHGSATTTEAVRRAIQHSQASLRALAKRYGINPKTVAKWKGRTSVADAPTGPKEPRSTVLSVEEEAVVVAFRRHTRCLPLDDCLYALQPTIPHLTRSSLHRCLQRHGISRLPQVEGEASAKRKFKAYPIGYFHIDIAEVRTAQGKLCLIVAIDRTSKFAFVELHEKAARRTAGDFLRHLIAAAPCKVHTVLTDNATHFTDATGENESRRLGHQTDPRHSASCFRAHAFEYACAQNDIDHRLTKPKHPWTNGQVERMNRTIKDATVKRYFYETHDQLRTHLRDLRRRLQLRQAAQDPQRPHPI